MTNVNITEPGLLIPVKWIRAVDGDTAEVEIRRRFKVRLRHIQTPEKGEDGFIEAKTEANLLGGGAHKVLLFIPSNNELELMDIHSFNRFVGDIILDGSNLADLLKEKSLGVDYDPKS